MNSEICRFENIVIAGKAIPNGAQYRFEIQEGVLKALTQAIQALRAN